MRCLFIGPVRITEAQNAESDVNSHSDEAHKASGSYAYTTILAYLTAHHPFFRVLALTATPGADVLRVQAVVDALHISRIEIREAEAPEIRKYLNEKVCAARSNQSSGRRHVWQEC